MMKQLIAITFLCFFLLGCNDKVEKNEKSERLIKVEPKVSQHHLFYAGVIQPIKTYIVTSPFEGIIQDMQFRYGDPVNKGQLLFQISSEKFQTDYKSSLMQYIKAKTDLNNSKSQLTEAKFLHKNQLISDDDFKSKRTAFYTSQLTLVEAEDALAKILKQLDVKGFNLYSLTIEDIDKITQILHSKDGSGRLTVLSPDSGLALLPVKVESSDAKKIGKGEAVKQGDILAIIGDLSGLAIVINVNEFNVNQIKVGQKVKISGTAFPHHLLDGVVESIDKQGQPSSGNVPMFQVNIVVPKLTKEQQQIIHVGMSAKVDIKIASEPVISIPISAIIDKNGEAYVKVMRDNKLLLEKVQTGRTSMNNIEITSNLKLGDEIAIVG